MQDVEEGRFIGIDLGKRTYELKYYEGSKVNGWNGQTTIAGRKSLYKRLKKTDIVAIEATSLAFVMEREMRADVGCTVYILNPAKLAIIYASMKKTDKEDALKLARFIKTCDFELLPIVTPPSDEELERRKILAEYRGLKRKRTREINMLHALFERNGITDVKKKDIARKSNRDIAIFKLHSLSLLMAQRYAERIDLLEKHIKIVEDMIKEKAKKDENIELLQTIPGVGPVIAFAFTAYVGDTRRFTNAHQLSNFVGLVPRVDISCTIVKYGSITKKGPNYLRGLITQSAWAMVRSNNGGYLKYKYDQMVRVRGKSKSKSITAIARKMLELMYTVVKNQTPFEQRIPNTRNISNARTSA